MNVKEMIETVVCKLTSDKDLLAEFQKDPSKTLESKLGINLPQEQIAAVVEGIKAKITIDKASDLIGALGGLFHK